MTNGENESDSSYSDGLEISDNYSSQYVNQESGAKKDENNVDVEI